MTDNTEFEIYLQPLFTIFSYVVVKVGVASIFLCVRKKLFVIFIYVSSFVVHILVQPFCIEFCQKNICNFLYSLDAVYYFLIENGQR